MSDIEALRNAVIEAARRQSREIPEDTLFALHDAVAALDKAEKPDPWALLAKHLPHTPSAFPDLYTQTKAALEWREQNDPQ